MKLNLARYNPITFEGIQPTISDEEIAFAPYEFEDNAYTRMIDEADVPDEILVEEPKQVVLTNLPIADNWDELVAKYHEQEEEKPKGRRVARRTEPYEGKEKWKTKLRQAYRNVGVTNENMLDILVSQDGLESSWGRSPSGKYNYGNITTGSSWTGDYVVSRDHDEKGNPIKQKFRSYASMDQYAKDKWRLLRRLYKIDENDDIDTFSTKLLSGRLKYALDPQYAAKLKSVYNSNRS